jgi:transposase
MNPVVGLDISKGESQVQAFVDKGKPFSSTWIKYQLLKKLSTYIRSCF